MIIYLKNSQKYFINHLSKEYGIFWHKYPPKLKISLLDIIVNISHEEKFANVRIFKAAIPTVS